jgi:predicted XRE-type DNA-binding protein
MRRQWIDPVPALKRQLADEIVARTDGQSQVWAAWQAQISRSRISELRRGNLQHVSFERLVQCLSRLGYSVEIKLARAPREAGRGRRCASGSGYAELGRREPTRND